jgi:NAD dependent epimerase/dehydratase family
VTRGLIGHTGFVGSTLDRQAAFDERYNSKNAGDMAGRHFDLLVCAGVSAAKWLANRHPDEDRRGIEALKAALSTVTADRFVLISTIDVYPDPSSGADETTEPDARDTHPYGAHRRALELWVQAQFPGAHIVRLPALFGSGLKKNALYDLLHDNMVDRINPASVFQWYPMARLWPDVERALAARLPIVNLFPQPLATSDLLRDIFPGARVGPAQHPAPAYRLATRHAALFGGTGKYLMSADTCLAAIRAWVADTRVAA